MAGYTHPNQTVSISLVGVTVYTTWGAFFILLVAILYVITFSPSQRSVLSPLPNHKTKHGICRLYFPHSFFCCCFCCSPKKKMFPEVQLCGQPERLRNGSRSALEQLSVRKPSEIEPPPPTWGVV